jgi:large exoprotein involved in heme utilization and adhesion
LFGDGIEFSATNPQAPLLTVNIPIGLRFRDNPGNITNRSVVQDITGSSVGLQVNPGNSLALVGGNVSLEQGGRLTAAGGRIELGGLAGAGTVGLQTNGNTFRLNFPANGLSNVSLLDDARVAVRSNGGGDIAVNANIFTGRNGGRLVGGVEGIATRNGGDITVNSNEFNISGIGQSGFEAGIYQQVLSDASGNAGNISITVNSLFLTNAQIDASTFGIGNAGNISLQVGDAIALTGSSIITANVQDGGSGIGGDVNIRGRSLTVTGGSQIQAGIFGQDSGLPEGIGTGDSGLSSGIGTGGSIKINTSDFIDISGFDPVLGFPSGIFAFAETGSIGSAGSIDITTNAFHLANSSGIFSDVESGASGNGGNITINARNLSLTSGAQINSSTSGDGIAGNIRVNATDSIFLNGVAPTVLQDGTAGGFSSGLFSSSDEANSGAGGQILVETPHLRILDGAVISATSRSAANAGNIRVNSQNVELRGGGQILATAFSGGNAGNIDVTSDRITISGTDPTYFARFNQVAQQFGGDIAEQRIDPVQPESGIFVNSTGTGQGGNLSITGNTLTLDRGVLSALTESGDGGNINLRLRNFIRLRNESLISANAGGLQGGNGGNITINTPFIVAFPQNNDIIANAVSGSGGQVRINAILFDIAPISAEDLRRLRPNDLDPRQLPTNDIPTRSLSILPSVILNFVLVELPETLTNTTPKIAQSPCRQGFGNEFAVTGRGGLPTSPNETLSSNNVRVDLLQPVASSGNSPSATIKPATTVTARRVPAQGWIFNDKGQVVLTAYDPTNTGSQRPFSTAACPAR